MKVRPISLMAAGAIVSIAVIVSVSTLFHPPNAQAQASSAAPAAGGVSVIVSPGSSESATASYITQGGTIVLHDSVNRKVTVVAFCNRIANDPENHPPSIVLSTNAFFTY